MKRYVADTHALYWHLTAAERLGKRAQEGDRGDASILVPAIVLAELYWILAKQGRGAMFETDLNALRQTPQSQLVDPLCDELGDLAAETDLSGMHDRMIAGVARRHGACLLSKDPQLQAVRGLTTIW